MRLMGSKSGSGSLRAEKRAVYQLHHRTNSAWQELINLINFELIRPKSAGKSKSRSTFNCSRGWTSLILIVIGVILLSEFQMVSSQPVIPDKQIEKPSSTIKSQVSSHHPHRHHHNQPRHSKHERGLRQHHLKQFKESFEMLDTSQSLSIVTPLEVLRQNMLLELQRKRIRHARLKQVQFNQEFLKKIG